MRFLLTISFLFLSQAQPKAEGLQLLIARLPLAGSQYYALDQAWQRIRPGDSLQLTREPRHPKDSNAIRVDWQSQPIGYLPRRRNPALAAAMDAGTSLSARVESVRQSADPWQRMEFAVFVDL